MEDEVVVRVVPSPKFHEYEDMLPVKKLEPEESKFTVSLLTFATNSAVGKTFGTVTVVVVEVLLAPSLSITVKVIV